MQPTYSFLPHCVSFRSSEARPDKKEALNYIMASLADGYYTDVMELQTGPAPLIDTTGLSAAISEAAYLIDTSTLPLELISVIDSYGQRRASVQLHAIHAGWHTFDLYIDGKNAWGWEYVEDNGWYVRRWKDVPIEWANDCLKMEGKRDRSWHLVANIMSTVVCAAIGIMCGASWLFASLAVITSAVSEILTFSRCSGYEFGGSYQVLMACALIPQLRVVAMTVRALIMLPGDYESGPRTLRWRISFLLAHCACIAWPWSIQLCSICSIVLTIALVRPR